MSSVDITNNIPFFRDALDEAEARALEIIGGKAGRYVKALVPVDTGSEHPEPQGARGSRTVVM